MCACVAAPPRSAPEADFLDAAAPIVGTAVGRKWKCMNGVRSPFKRKENAMLEPGTKVVQDPKLPMSVRLEGGPDGSRTVVCQMNGNQRTDEERSADCRVVVGAINACLNGNKPGMILVIDEFDNHHQTDEIDDSVIEAINDGAWNAFRVKDGVFQSHDGHDWVAVPSLS